MPVREKKYYAGNFLEVEIYPISIQEQKKKRGKKKKESRKEQKNLNSKNSRKHLGRIFHANFTNKDNVIHLSYDAKNLPKSEEEAIRDRNNFIRRVKNYMKKHGLGELKYIAVLEYREAVEGDRRTSIRIHHHIVMTGMNRDDVENLWKKGRANADRLKSNEVGYQELANYLAKDPRGKKRWCQSRNLIIPEAQINDWKYSRRKLMDMSRNADRREFEKLYPGYVFTDIQVVVNDLYGGTYIYVRMRKLE